MEPLGELRTEDGLWAAVVYANADGVFDFRLFQLSADKAGWVMVEGQAEKSFGTQKAAISAARACYPQLAKAPYRIEPSEDPPESPQSLRGRFMLFGGVALVAGVSFLVVENFWAGLVALTIGCLLFGWSIGGHGGGGYGGSNS